MTAKPGRRDTSAAGAETEIVGGDVVGKLRQVQASRGEGVYLLRGSLAQHRPEYAIPQRCADAVVSRCELMMTLVVLKQ
jgi:hypothetical protein